MRALKYRATSPLSALVVRELPPASHRPRPATTWAMKKASLTVPLLAASGLAGATTAAWPDASILSIVAPADNAHATAADPEPCSTEDLARYFVVPLGSHDLVMAQIAYMLRHLDPPCSSLKPYPPRDQERCPPLDKDTWCRFSTAPEAADVLPAYSAYGSSASAWWEAHSASAISLARRCPWSWWRAASEADLSRSGPDEAPWGSKQLNGTLLFAQCYAEAHATASGEPAAPAATSGPEARPGSGTASGAAATGSATLPENGGLGRDDAMGRCMSWGLAAAAVAAAW